MFVDGDNYVVMWSSTKSLPVSEIHLLENTAVIDLIVKCELTQQWKMMMWKSFDVMPKMSSFQVSGLLCLSAFLSTVDANSNCSYSASNDSLYCTISQLRTIRTVSSHSSGNYQWNLMIIWNLFSLKSIFCQS